MEIRFALSGFQNQTWAHKVLLEAANLSQFSTLGLAVVESEIVLS